jgi:hypothetical protein
MHRRLTYNYSITTVSGNYLMPEWGVINSKFSLRESYELFLKLRQKGIRSHSWV